MTYRNIRTFFFAFSPNFISVAFTLFLLPPSPCLHGLFRAGFPKSETSVNDKICKIPYKPAILQRPRTMYQHQKHPRRWRKTLVGLTRWRGSANRDRGIPPQGPGAGPFHFRARGYSPYHAHAAVDYVDALLEIAVVLAKINAVKGVDSPPRRNCVTGNGGDSR